MGASIYLSRGKVNSLNIPYTVQSYPVKRAVIEEDCSLEERMKLYLEIGRVIPRGSAMQFIIENEETINDFLKDMRAQSSQDLVGKIVAVYRIVDSNMLLGIGPCTAI